MFAPPVEQWRPLALEESQGVPVDLVLATIARESRGVAGDVGYTDTAHGYTDAEIAACGLPVALRRRALGLMQIAPRTWRSYVTSTGSQITPCDLAGTSYAAARAQIRIGCAVLRSCLVWADWRGEPVPSDAIVLMARLAYARGVDAVRHKLAAAAAAGYPATFEGLEAYAPTWGHPDRPFDGACAILAAYRSGGRARAPSSPRPPASGSGSVAVLAGIGLVLWALSRDHA